MASSKSTPWLCGSNSCRGNTPLFACGATLCLILSPCRAVYSTWSAHIEDDHVYGKELIIDFSPQIGSQETEDDDFDVDIVAVHGLASHPVRAWEFDPEKPDGKPDKLSPGKHTLWLRDFLPHEQKLRPRVLVYRHDSHWLFGAVNKSLSNYGDELIQALKLKRTTSKEQNRPLIFIGHSFGGIIIKQMLVNAHMSKHDLSNQRLLSSTKGLVFMGTPHKGARIATIGILLSLFGFWEGSSAAFLEFLKLDSQANRRLHMDFLRLLPGVCGIENTFCIFETVPMKLFGLPFTEVVSQESAVIESCPNILGVSKHHSSMQRLSGQDDEAYKLIVLYLTKWTSAGSDRDSSATIDSQEDKEILNSLSFSTMLARQDRIGESHQNTCHWILEHEHFQSWIKGNDPVLWLLGNPGTGKSTLISFLSRSFSTNLESTPPVIMEFYFDGSSEHINKSCEGLLRSLLHQLYQKAPSVRAVIRTVLLAKKTDVFSDSRRMKWLQRDIETALSAALKTLVDPRPVLLVDALDEADEKELRLIIPCLQKLVSRTRVSDVMQESLVRLVISCRHRPSIIRLSGEKIYVENHNHLDVVEYLEHHLHPDVIDQKHILNQQLWTKLTDELIDRAASNFQWAYIIAHLAGRYVNEACTISIIRERLFRLPAELSALYTHLLEEVIDPDDRAKALLLLQWVCLGERHMSLKELRYAMVIEDAAMTPSEKRCGEMEDFVDNDEMMATQIVALSGGLLEVVYYDSNRTDRHKRLDIVRTVHQSVLDFMLSDGLRRLASSQQFPARNDLISASLRSENADPVSLERFQHTMDLDVLISAGHYRLYMACICYYMREQPLYGLHHLRLDDSVYNYSDLKEYQIHSVLSYRPLLRYAITALFYHATKAQLFQNHIDCDWNSAVGWLKEVFDDYAIIRNSIDPVGNLQLGTELIHIAAQHNLLGILSASSSDLPRRINSSDDHGWTMMHYASKHGHPEAVRLLLRYGAEANVMNFSGRTPLMEAIGGERCDSNDCYSLNCRGFLPPTERQLEIVKLLLASGAIPALGSGPSGTALQEAARHGRTEVVELLLDSGVPANLISGREGTALMDATLHGNASTIDLLIKRGADVNLIAGEFETPLSGAVIQGHMAAFDVLLGAGALVNPPGLSETPMTFAVRKFEDQMLQKMFSKLKNDMERAEVLNVLIGLKSLEPRMLETLFQLATGIGFSPAYLDRALYLACEMPYSSSTDVVECLLAAGADVNVRRLAETDSDIHFTVKRKYSNAIQAAAGSGRADIVRILIAEGVDVNAREEMGETALMCAIRGDRHHRQELIECASLLIEAGVDVNAVCNRRGAATSMESALRRSFDEMVKLLKDVGVEEVSLVPYRWWEVDW